MGRTFCSSDWHGCDVAFKVFDFLKEDDTLFFLGDAIDRGPHGLKLLEKLLNDPRVIFIKGNHEEMMIASMEEIFDFGKRGGKQWIQLNGGKSTWEAIQKKYPSMNEQQKLIEKIELKTRLCVKYKNKNGKDIILEHAGHTPWGVSNRRHDPLWDREHFNDPYNSKGENIYIVHGHTPVQYMQFLFGYINQPPKTKEELKLKNKFLADDNMGDWKPTILHYCEGHKINIDMCTISSGRVAVLDLDTFEEFYFDE